MIGRYYVESPENAEVFVKKYLPDSTLVWSDTTSGSDLKLPIAAQVDAQGNVYVLAQYAYQNVSPIVVYRFNALREMSTGTSHSFPPAISNNQPRAT